MHADTIVVSQTDREIVMMYESMLEQVVTTTTVEVVTHKFTRGDVVAVQLPTSRRTFVYEVQGVSYGDPYAGGDPRPCYEVRQLRRDRYTNELYTSVPVQKVGIKFVDDNGLCIDTMTNWEMHADAS